MTAGLIVLAVALMLSAACLVSVLRQNAAGRKAQALLLERSADGLMQDRGRLTVVVTMRSGAAFRGVLYEVDARTLALRNGEQLSADGNHTKVDGEILLARPDVDYIQRP